jgi:putative ABC transport system ATP-binding protein
MIDTSLFGFGKKRQAIIDRCDALIASVGLCDQAKQWPNTLSGGERQRTALARALMMQPKILFADEPTGNLDSCAGKAILDILIELNRKGQTIVMVTHDEKVGALADRTLHLIDGKLS